MKIDEMAIPLALVVSVSDVVPLAKVPEAPELGALKVTITSDTGLPYASVTVA